MVARARGFPALGLLAGPLLLWVQLAHATPDAGVEPGPTPGTAKECVAGGGIWDPVQGRGHVTGCNPSTRDGGKACTDSSQCEGVCQHGTCTPNRFGRGCGIVRDGRTLCID